MFLQDHNSLSQTLVNYFNVFVIITITYHLYIFFLQHYHVVIGSRGFTPNSKILRFNSHPGMPSRWWTSFQSSPEVMLPQWVLVPPSRHSIPPPSFRTTAWSNGALTTTPPTTPRDTLTYQLWPQLFQGLQSLKYSRSLTLSSHVDGDSYITCNIYMWY